MGNTLYTGDNLFVLTGLDSASVDLIYLDPPFNSKRMYSAPIGSKASGASFKDMWSWDDVNEAYLERLYGEHSMLYHYIEAVGYIHGNAMKAYLSFMAQRMIEMHRILRDTGSLYLHCDPTASHYLKIILDALFGKQHFRNEIIWKKDASGKGGKRVSKQWPRLQDVLFLYAKTEKFYFKQPYNELTEAQAKAYTKKEAGSGRQFKVVQLGNYSKASIQKLKKQGLIYQSNTGKTYKKYYLDEAKASIDSIWTDIKGFGIRTNAKERTGYPTQKPLALLHRIIEASSKEGDVVLDPFCGCATTCVSAQHLGRQWIGIDIEEKTKELVIERLSNAKRVFTGFVPRKDIPKRTDIKEEKPSIPIKSQLYKEQAGLCYGCYVKMEERNLEIDHIIPKSKGGGGYKENYQLLCGYCNKTKTDQPHDYLTAKVRARQEALERMSCVGKSEVLAETA